MESHGEQTSSHTGASRRGSFLRVFFGVLIVGIGVLYLLRAWGILSVSFHVPHISLWPLLLILLGVMSLPRHGSWPLVVKTGAASIAAGIILASFVFGSFTQVWNGGFSENRIIAIPLGEHTKRLNLAIDAAAGTLSLEGGSPILVSGDFESHGARLHIVHEEGGLTEKVYIKTEELWKSLTEGPQAMRVKVASHVPIDADIQLGALDTSLDFRDIMLESLHLSSAASRIRVAFGVNTSSTRAVISAGASDVTLVFPRAAGVRLHMNAGLSAEDVSDFSFLGNGEYISEGYEGKMIHIDVDVSAGVSHITTEWD